jgi:hypothetical protein
LALPRSLLLAHEVEFGARRWRPPAPGPDERVDVLDRVGQDLSENAGSLTLRTDLDELEAVIRPRCDWKAGSPAPG